ncbi:MAG: hypothetical protein Q4F80_05195 [bacterium]|nr:hypothetical protein [bacterium]
MINKINTQSINNKIANRFAKMGEIGEGASIACDFLGKALVVPAVIMLASNEDKEKKEYSAIKNPVAAFIQLGLEVPVLAMGSKIVGDLADKGFFDKKGSDFSYNEKKMKEAFVDTFEKHNPKEKAGEFIKTIKEKGYTKKTAELFEEISAPLVGKAKEETVSAFKKLESTHKNQFHLKNRICFMAALVLTPVLCAIENKAHPKIMDMLYQKRDKKRPKMPDLLPDLKDFLKHSKRREK